MHLRMTPTRRVLVAIVAAIIAFPAGAWPPSVQAVSGGTPYDVDVVTDTNPAANIVETTIIADEADVNIGGGVTAHAYTFNGKIPGPEFRLNVNDRVIVHFENHLLNEPTGIHWHGIELQNPSDGTPLTQNQVPPGETFLYDFVVKRPGVYWYHPHHEFSTNQVFKGLYGTIIVTDPNEAGLIAAGKLPSLANTRTLALGDITVCDASGSNDRFTYDPGETDATYDPPAWHWQGGGALPEQQAPNPVDLCESPIDNHGEPLGAALGAGDVPNIQKHTGRVNEGQTVLTNGVNVGHRAGTPSLPGALDPGASKLAIAPGQGLRLRIGNAATTRFMHLRLTNDTGAFQPLYRVGGEGGLLDEVQKDGTPAGGFDFDYEEGEILLDPGDRTDVVIAFPLAATGVWTLWTEDFRRTGAGDGAAGWLRIPTVPVAHFDMSLPALGAAFTIAEGDDLRLLVDPVEHLPAATGTLVDPTLFPTPQDGMPAQNIKITVNPPSIDDVPGEHDFTIDFSQQLHPDSNRWAFLGDTLSLSVTNTTPADHPFHLHGFSIQPLKYTNCKNFADVAQPDYVHPPEFMDNIDLPGKCTLTFKVRLDDRMFPDGTPGAGAGRWMLHCHIFFHHHQGMVSELTVITPDVAITSVAPPGLVYPVGTNVTVNTKSIGSLTPTYDWDDNGATSAGAPTDGSGGFAASHTFTAAGVYTVTATVEKNGFEDSDSVMIVIFDPSAGFVTGGGTITSAAGSYVADATLTGTAHFGFVSKYQKGATTPTGQTEFKFQVADFDFHSTSYEWLVVAGAKAMYKGEGTVNGTGDYGFLLSAVDGQQNGGGGTDKFRIKIWDMNNGDAVVYDNNLGASEDIDNSGPQALKSGSVVIHSGK